jgi:hypothetical protein
MRHTASLCSILTLATAGALLAAACSGGDAPASGDGGTDDPDPWEITEVSLIPANTVLTVENGTPAEQIYVAMATFGDGHTEDVTDDATFAINPGPLGDFTDNLLVTSSTHGGQATVSATVSSAIGQTGVTVNIHTVHIDEGAPDDADSLFDGTDNPAQAPTLLYPPDGVLIPPNLADVDFQWDPGAGNDLWQIKLVGEYLDMEVYLADLSFIPQDLLWEQLVPGNGGLEPVEVTVTGTSTADPSTKGVSETIGYSVAEEPVEGGIYYWAASSVVASDYGIFRYDFGEPGQLAEQAYTTAQTGDRCVACHALSHDGTKMALTYDGGDGAADIVDVASQSPILPVENAYFANFHTYSADDQYVLGVSHGVFTLRDGSNGAAVETLALTNVTYPDWSLDGGTMAFTRATRDFYGDWHFLGGQIEVMTFNGPGIWGEPEVIVPAEPDVNYYYPAISPDTSWIIFNKSSELGAYTSPGDSYSDDDAQLWVTAIDGGDPIALDAANLTGNLRTSWAKWCPKISSYKGDELLWFTVSSMRRYGAHLADGELPQIWMAAFSPTRAENGEDPTWPAFYLPFQDITTNNHIAQWTEVVVDIQ